MARAYIMLSLLYTLLLTASLAGGTGTSLWVETTPQYPRPYALKKGHGIALPGGNTFPVTGNSSANAFCILSTHAAGSNGNTGLGLFPHVHQKTYENFYASKGRVQLWGQNLAAYRANTSIQQTRVLGPGDSGAIPPGTIHTFSLLEPDTLLTGILVPGGFEEFFFNFDGSIINNSTSDGLARWDVYPEPGFIPRRDVRDGKAGPGNWYDGPNELPEGMAEPVWVAKNHGPKWLNSEGGRYQIVAPLVTGRQTGGMFSQGTVTVSPFVADGHGEVGMREGSGVRSEVATAFVVEEGQLEVRVEGYEPVSLIDGDVVFVPGNTSFWYEAAAEFTKFMYVTGGGKGLDYDLMAHAQPWDSTFYPQLEGSRMNRGMMSRI